jgi:hypothetical protein
VEGELPYIVSKNEEEEEKRLGWVHEPLVCRVSLTCGYKLTEQLL